MILYFVVIVNVIVKMLVYMLVIDLVFKLGGIDFRYVEKRGVKVLLVFGLLGIVVLKMVG